MKRSTLRTIKRLLEVPRVINADSKRAYIDSYGYFHVMDAVQTTWYVGYNVPISQCQGHLGARRLVMVGVVTWIFSENGVKS